MHQGYDYLIILSVGTTKERSYGTQSEETQNSSNLSNILSEDNQSLESIGKIIEFNWISYDMKKQIPTKQVQAFIKSDEFDLSEETLKKNRITAQNFLNAVTLNKAVEELNAYIYLEIIVSSGSFCIVTFGDDMFTRTLPKNFKDNNMKFAPHFYQYFDIFTEFKQYCPGTNNLKTLSELMTFTNLKEKEGTTDSFSQSETKSIIRLVNMLNRAGYVFNSPKIINHQYQLVIDNRDEKTRYVMQREQKTKINYIRGRSPQPFKNTTRGHYLRLRGFHSNSRENEVCEFLRNVRVYQEDIFFLYDYDGKSTGQVYARLWNESDKYEALNFHYSEFFDRTIEVYETTEIEYQRARDSQNAEKREMPVKPPGIDNVIKDMDQLLRNGGGLVRIKGLRHNATEQDIKKFFKGLSIVPGGIKRAVVGGKPYGECFVIFTNREDAHKALSQHMEQIGNRFIEVFLATSEDFHNYMAHNFVNSAQHYSQDNMPNIPLEQRKCTLLVMGLPYNVNQQQIYQFFAGYDIIDRQVHMLTSHSGQFCGNALVCFEDEMEAQRALKTKNFSYIGNRFLELFEYK